MDQDVLTIEARAGVARAAALAQDDLADAFGRGGHDHGFPRSALSASEVEHGLSGGEEPLWVYLTCYQVLQAAGDARASVAFNRAYAILQAQMHALPDEQRQNFLRNVPYHRQIIEALIALNQQMLGLDQHASNLTTPPQPAAVPVVDLQNASLCVRPAHRRNPQPCFAGRGRFEQCRPARSQSRWFRFIRLQFGWRKPAWRRSDRRRCARGQTLRTRSCRAPIWKRSNTTKIRVAGEICSAHLSKAERLRLTVPGT